MSKKKKSYSAEFKTKVVLELLREEDPRIDDCRPIRHHSTDIESVEEKIPARRFLGIRYE